jgi:endonuclease YncB( thermonuclease family)
MQRAPFLCAAAAAILAAPAAAPAAAGLGPYVAARVVSVHDGDTQRFRIERTGHVVKVRVVGIDTPEVPPEPTECDGPKATAAAGRVLTAGRRVWLRVDRAAGTTDRYGRALRVVYLSRRKTLERFLLLRGLENVYDFDHERLTLLGAWLAQRGAALRAGAGAWDACPGPAGHGPSRDVYRAWSTGRPRGS